MVSAQWDCLMKLPPSAAILVYLTVCNTCPAGSKQVFFNVHVMNIGIHNFYNDNTVHSTGTYAMVQNAENSLNLNN